MSAMELLNDKQRRFAQLVVLELVPAGRAYEAVGYTAKGNSADAAASKLLRNNKVQAYLTELREESKTDTVMTLGGMKEWLTRAVTTPLREIDDGHPLCVEYTVTTTEDGGAIKKKKVDPLRSLVELAKLEKHYDPQEVKLSADDDLSELLKGLANTAQGGEDKM